MFRKSFLRSVALGQTQNEDIGFNMEVEQPTMTMMGEFPTPVAIKGKSEKFHHSTQVGKNIAKVRWLEPMTPLVAADPLATENFIVGTCGRSENEVSLWQFNVEQGPEERKCDLRVISKNPIGGSVTDLVAFDSDRFAITTSLGNLSMFEVSQSSDDSSMDVLTHISPTFSQTLHAFKKGNFPCAATGLALSETALVTVGEDGSINELDLGTNSTVQSLKFVDPLTLCTVKYLGRSTIVTGNAAGQVKIWDLRISTPRAALQTMNHLSELAGAISIAQHPVQGHIILIGYESGNMDLWDTRQGSISEPTATLPSQEGGGISEICFHGFNSENFFTASQSGEVNHWFPSRPDPSMILVQNNDYDVDLNIAFLRYGLNWKTLYSSSFPANSMSFSRNNRLICGGDSGIVYASEIDL